MGIPLSRKPQRHFRWYHLYFLLAAFDLVTIAASLYISHFGNAIFSEAVVTNSFWLNQLTHANKLGSLASKANAPGNDVFDSREPDTESQRLEIARVDFYQAFQEAEGEIARASGSRPIDPAGASLLLKELTEIRLAFDLMVAEAQQIFSLFKEGDTASAGARMATMDRRYADLNRAIDILRTSEHSLMTGALHEQRQRAESLQWLEFVVMGFAVLMIIGATVYGRKFALRMYQAEVEREQHSTQLTAINRELERSEVRTRTLTEQAPVGIFETDETGRCVYVNKEWQRIAGLTLTEARNNGWSEAIHPDDREKVRKEWYDCAHAGRIFALEYRFVDKNGQATWVYGTAAPIQLADNSTVGYVGSLTDISKLKSVEESLHKARIAAEATTRIKGEFLANMSHEIRTPLNGVIGMLDLLLDSELRDQQTELAVTAKMSGQILLKIVNEILDFSKIESGKLQIAREPFEVNALFADLVRIHEFELSKRKIALISEIQPDLPDSFHGDRDRLSQIFVNLIGNASKFTPAGGAIILRCSGRATNLNTWQVEFSVGDTGIGIPEERQQAIFEAFTQADGSTTRKYGGTGLGLTICARFVELMGGKLSVRSRPGCGSVFFFELQMEQASPGAQAEAKVSSTTSGPHAESLHMLLVEDNLVNQRVAKAILEKAGHVVTVANNGKEAVDASEQSEFDVILMDIQMPVMGGVEAIQRIRQRESDLQQSRIPIVALTAHAMPEDREKYLALGADGYVVKPLVRADLFRAINALFAE
jgi:PAS domain S-box-containing protein